MSKEVLTPAEIERRADEELRKLGQDGIAEFLSKLDDLGSEDGKIAINREDLSQLVQEADRRNLDIVMIPEMSVEALEAKAREFAHTAATKFPIAIDEEAAYEKILSLMKSGEATERVAKAVGDIAAKFKAMPEPFSIAINALEKARKIYDGNGGGLWPLVDVKLMSALLKLNANCQEKFVWDNKHSMVVSWNHKVAETKMRLLKALSLMIAAGGACAKRLDSAALPLWKSAIFEFCRITHTKIDPKTGKESRADNGTLRPWSDKETDKLFRLVKEARESMFADSVIYGYASGKGVR